MAKTLLPNGCAYGKISVTPSNWDQAGACVKRDWLIHYRFYDPRHPKPKAVQIRGMNEYHTLEDRRRQTRKFIADELELLREHGYNPFDASFETPIAQAPAEPGVLSDQSPFGEALDLAYSMLKLADSTMDALKVTIGQVKGIAAGIREKGTTLLDLPVSAIRKPHVRAILEKMATNLRTGEYSANKFNAQRSYLMILFGEMEELDAVASNIPGGIKKKKTVRKLRETLTKAQRKVINDWLYKHFPHFWRALHIFFESGAREREMMDVKREDVDLKRQVVKYLVLKGGKYREVERTIKDSVLHLWRELVAMAQPGHYLFSKGLAPGPNPIRREQLSRYWYRHVKNKKKDRKITSSRVTFIKRIPIKVTADFYSLKHTHSTEMKQELGSKATADHNAHSVAVLDKYYDVARKDDQATVKSSTVGFV